HLPTPPTHVLRYPSLHDALPTSKSQHWPFRLCEGGGKGANVFVTRRAGHHGHVPVGKTNPPGFCFKLQGGRLVRRFGIGSVVDRSKSTRLNSSHVKSSYAVFCLK